MTLPRGFKANAEREATRLRNELDLKPSDPLDMLRLAEHLGVKVIAGDRLIERSRFEELEALQVGVFSAATFEVRGRKVIVTSPLQSSGRLNSDIAHELSHILLNHTLSEIREVAGVPFRTCRPEEEEQATAFGGTLLLPRPLLLSAAWRNSARPELVAQRYDVSLDMARFRINTTGVQKQAQRSH
ncbi:ImmA/IrrE family metallo-endopeptidase [Humibacter sp.]|uniref:ImmA/IrrE family metallo-endopeptidase n=1 Tax=Humibacter sp. TaxID=1940291 RepID=UPI003F7F697B